MIKDRGSNHSQLISELSYAGMVHMVVSCICLWNMYNGPTHFYFTQCMEKSIRIFRVTPNEIPHSY